MANILPENETFTFEDREYVNPQVSLDEQNAFIDNLRQTQQQNTGGIVQQTRNLGTEVPSNLGGLVGGEGYWTSRYQTPQTNTLVSQLRATAQAQALNNVLENEQAIWKNRYQKAYRNYQRRSNSGGDGDGSDKKTDNPTEAGEVDKETTTSTDFFGVPNANVRYDESSNMYIYSDPDTGEEVKISKDYLDKIFDENGNITEDGQVILETRKMLGM